MKRYMMLVQHEVIIYGEDEQAAQRSLLRVMGNRTNLKCVYITELPMPNDTKSKVFEDCRKAPGA